MTFRKVKVFSKFSYKIKIKELYIIDHYLSSSSLSKQSRIGIGSVLF